MKNGFFYIATTPQYVQKNVYKISATQNLEQELELLNYNRIPDEEYYMIIYWNTFAYKILEYNIIEKLKIYRIKNNLFSCNIYILRDIYNNFVYSQSFMTFFYDYLYLFGIHYNIKWDAQYCIFLVNNTPCHEQYIIYNMKEIFNYFNMNHLLSYINEQDYQIYLQFLKDNFDK